MNNTETDAALSVFKFSNVSKRAFQMCDNTCDHIVIILLHYYMWKTTPLSVNRFY